MCFCLLNFTSYLEEKVSSHNLDLGFETHLQLQCTDKNRFKVLRYILVKCLKLMNVVIIR